MCKMNWKTRIFRNPARKKSFFSHFLTRQSNWPELPRKWKMENFEVFLKNMWLKCPKPIISWLHSIVGITIKRLVHIAGLQIIPSSQNLSSKLKSGPNYHVWRYMIKIDIIMRHATFLGNSSNKFLNLKFLLYLLSDSEKLAVFLVKFSFCYFLFKVVGCVKFDFFCYYQNPSE
jgi:hypothetical protein